jgi:hypothetical protein
MRLNEDRERVGESDDGTGVTARPIVANAPVSA